ncbi:hypothetical protein DAPPUDRAFT_239866 [Daphnia pulex]|uniref:ribonuclease H n=1 Tax=Daphnia pulex TaxID=6669 RepID=E9GA95_DAPPU|nr:hypothetical protein DAPPUDRAFT_239866 [Daphnia pulex]|eukprot:EFX83745.1 hypothetical protein DAPPUDRAFT_239866 [Daphnia pulex]
MSFYAVARGRRVGIYPNTTFFRAECQSQIQGYPGAQFKKFSSQQEAEGFIQQRNSDTPEILPVKPRASQLPKASDDLKKFESSFSGSGNQSPTAKASTSGSQSKAECKAQVDGCGLPNTESLKPRKKLNSSFRKIKFKREPEPPMFLNLANLY